MKGTSHVALPLTVLLSLGACACACAPSVDRSVQTTLARPHAAASLVASSFGHELCKSVEGGRFETTVEETVWAEPIRNEDWRRAWEMLDALSEAEKSKPHVRYATARVLLGLGKPKEALTSLEGLETSLAIIADEIARRRAEAQAAAGRFADAATYYARLDGPAAQLEAARLFEKTGDRSNALQAIDRVLRCAHMTRSQRAEARSLRARLSTNAPEIAQADARWLATEGADLAPAADALSLLSALAPEHPLEAREWLLRSRVLARARRTDEALEALELERVAPGAELVARVATLRARALALYESRGRYREAAGAFEECVPEDRVGAAEDSFLAARALSRADHDEEAVAAYARVRRRFPATSFAEEAAYFVPYLHMLHGSWGPCASGFSDYIALRPDPRRSHEAGQYEALCLLMQGNFARARASFAALAERAKDGAAEGRARTLQALAERNSGDQSSAVADWQALAFGDPLSWGGLVARAHLAEMGIALPRMTTPRDDAPANAPPAIPGAAALYHDLGFDADAEQVLEQSERTWAVDAGRDRVERECAVYGRLPRARRMYQLAQTAFGSNLGTRMTPDKRWAWRCSYPTPFEEAVRESESVEHLPHWLLWAVMRQESGFNPDADSPAHALGLMQLLPETATTLATELGLVPDASLLTQPRYSIRLGARALRKLLDRYDQSIALSVAAYNAGHGAIDRWLSRAPGMKLDTFVERIPFVETREYTIHVVENWAHYAYLLDGNIENVALDLSLPSESESTGATRDSVDPTR